MISSNRMMLAGLKKCMPTTSCGRLVAAAIAVNAKAQRVSVCNAMETLLVDAAVAAGVILLHWRNIQRLLNGTERRIELRR